MNEMNQDCSTTLKINNTWFYEKYWFDFKVN